MKSFDSYDAYQERYRLFYSEEGDQRPPMMNEEEFHERFQMLVESYQSYRDLVVMGNQDQANLFYQQVINQLENQLAIADASDNFGQWIL